MIIVLWKIMLTLFYKILCIFYIEYVCVYNYKDDKLLDIITNCMNVEFIIKSKRKSVIIYFLVFIFYYSTTIRLLHYKRIYIYIYKLCIIKVRGLDFLPYELVLDFVGFIHSTYYFFFC